MSIGKQFKRQGEIGAALVLWGVVIWFFSSLKRVIITFTVVIILIISLSVILDDTGEIFYVNSDNLELLDKPFGQKVKSLEMNDSLVLIRELSDGWFKVKVDDDTLYFADNFYYGGEMGYTYKIQKTPFTKWKALKGEKVSINHPDGFFEIGGTMFKNGDEIHVIDFSESENKVKFKTPKGSNSHIDVEFLNIDWESIFSKYPNLKM